MFLNVGHTLTAGHITKSTVFDFICDPDRGFKGNHVYSLNAIKMHLQSKGAKIWNRYNQVPYLTQDTNGKLTNSQLDTTNESQEVSPFKSSGAIYVLALLTNVNVEANSVGLDRQHSVSSLFDSEAFKTFQQSIKPDDFAVISALRIKIQAKITYLYSNLLLHIFAEIISL